MNKRGGTLLVVGIIMFLILFGIIGFIVLTDNGSEEEPKVESNNLNEEDEDGSESDNSLNFDNCKEVIEGHNNINLNRANIVFSGAGYNNDLTSSYTDFTHDEILYGISGYLIDFEGNNQGLFSLEPFKSNKDKFNFWYVTEPGPLKESYKFSNLNGFDYLADNCQLPNKYSVILLNEEGFTNAKVLSYNVIGIGPSENIEFNLERRSPIRTFTHEFGHSFGKLVDEYVNFPDSSSHEFDSFPTPNCYKAISESDCLLNAPWKEFVGDGCGQPGIIDCQEGIDYNYNLEIGCFEGCDRLGKGIYRSTNLNLMVSPTEPISYGKWNEKLIQDQIDLYS